VERQGRLVTRDELMQAVWPDVAVTDESISKCIADIRKALADDSQIIVRTVTRRGFLFQAEVTVAGTLPLRAGPPSPPPAIEPPRRRRLLLTATVALAVLTGVVTLLARKLPFGHRRSFEAIAVLPFECLSGDSDQQYLADGMTEALITSLGESSPLRVIARTSVNQYLKTRKPIREVAQELGVDAIVEGTVSRAGDRLRVTANLIQVSPEKHIWAHSYDRDLRDVLALQNEIASAITAGVQGKLTPRQRSRLDGARPVDPEAQLAYWRAKYLMNNTKGDVQAVQKIVDYAAKAVQLDPGYAPAHAVLARGHVLSAAIGAAWPSRATPPARAAAERALALDERLVSGHVALAYILLFSWDWVGAEREARRAIELNPSDAEGHLALANYLAAVGRVDEAVTEMKAAKRLDPLSFFTNWNVGRMLCLARRYDEALAELRQTGDLQQNSSGVDIWVFKANWMKGQFDQAIAADLRIRGYRDGLPAASLEGLQAAFRKNGPGAYWTRVRKLVLPQYAENPIGWYRLAEINTYLGDNDQAFQWLEKALNERPDWIPFLKVEPTLDPLRADPRFTALLQRMGLN
jgi:TolB-like protein/Tfp pilus assembly protein PilF